jgi:hypothetical protein
MEEHGPAYQPEHTGAPRRGRFRKETVAPEPSAVSTSDQDVVERSVDERLEKVIGEIERRATELMREVAAEVWRTGAADVRPEQERIVSLLSRDQAIKSLMATSDERFQSLAVRSARLEEDLLELAAQGRATREAIETSVAAVRQVALSPAVHGVDEVRGKLEQVEAHIAAAFAHMDERDRAITEEALQQVRDHGDLIAEHVAGRVGGALAPVGEQLDMLSERVGISARSQQEIQAALERLVDARMRSLAELIRSDSMALRGLIEGRATDAGLGEGDAAPLIASFEEHMTALTMATERQVQAMSRTAEQQVTALATATNAAIERHVAEIEGRIEQMSDTVSARVAEVAELAITGALGQTLERMSSSAGALEGVDTMIAESQSMAEERAQQGRVELEQSLMAHVDDRMTSIARLIRSDNQRLAERLTASPEHDAPGAQTLDPELLRETLRTMKELQAGMASEVVGTVDTRIRAVSDQLHTETQSTAEAMIKVAEVLGQKIDRLSVRVDEGYGQDLQVVIERMGDAIRAMSTTGRRYDVG